MPRSLIIKSGTHPYHIMSRCNNKEFFPIPLTEVWFIMTRLLLRIHKEKKLAIHAFVLMGNHFHLLCHTPEGNIDDCMQSFLRSVTIEVNRRANRQNHLWGDRYRWSLIESQTHYFQVYRYIYQNPLRAKLVLRVEDYPYSTLRKDIPFPLSTFIPLSFGGEEGELIWLNQEYESEDLKLIQSGLRRSQFDIEKRKLKAFNKLTKPYSNTSSRVKAKE